MAPTPSRPLKFAMLKRRLLLNLVLLFFLIGLIVFISTPKPKAPALPGVVLAPAIHADTVRVIRIERPSRPTLVFKRQHGYWRLTRPLHAPANTLLIKTLLSIPQARSDRAYAIEKSALPRFGLQPPRAVIFYGDTPITLGALNSLTQRRYVFCAGKLYLIPDRLADLPQSPALAWVSHALLPPGARIVAIETPDIHLQRQASGRWEATGHTGRISPSAIDKWLAFWRQARALRVTPASRSTGKKKREIRITLANGRTVLYQIVAVKPSLILRNTRLGADYWLPPGLTAAIILRPAPETPGKVGFSGRS